MRVARSNESNDTQRQMLLHFEILFIWRNTLPPLRSNELLFELLGGTAFHSRCDREECAG